MFAGDILLSDHVLGAYDEAGISGVVDGTFVPSLTGDDVFMVMRTSHSATERRRRITVHLPPASGEGIHIQAGIDIVTLANNHALILGQMPCWDTCDTLDQAGIFRVGAANLDEAKVLPSWK